MTKHRFYLGSALVIGLATAIALTVAPSLIASDPAAPAQSVEEPIPVADPTLREEQRLQIEKQNALANPPTVADSTEPDAATPTENGQVEQQAPQVRLFDEPVEQEPITLKKEGGGPRAPILASRRLSYQAVLTDNSGNALPGPTVNLTFNIYTSGAVLVEGPINVAAVPINDGVVDTSFPVSAATFDGADRLVGISVNAGPELTPRISLTTVPYSLRVDRVASEELDDAITLGRGSAPFASGSLGIQNGIMAQPSIFMIGSQISTYGSDGLEQIRLWGPTWGEILLNDDTGNNTTVFISATSDFGGQLALRNNAASNRVQILGGGTNGAGEMLIGDADGTTSIQLMGAEIAADGGQIFINNDTGINTIELDGDSANSGFISVKDSAGAAKVFLDGESGGGGLVTVDQSDGSTGVTIDGDNGTDVGGLINVHDSTGATRVQLLGEGAGTGGDVSIFDDNGSETVSISGAETATTGGQIIIRDSAGLSQIELDGEFGITGDPGRIVTPVLQITGGADLSEDFDVAGESAGPGMVVCIDEHNSGKLTISSKAYDRKVAGIISGANGIRTGLLMGQKRSSTGDASIADGKLPIALTGRVYCLVDATQDEVVPGDLLTTSDTAGHAMKVLDYGRAQGAVIGKAMTRLAKGEKGLVLVLVTMQ